MFKITLTICVCCVFFWHQEMGWPKIIWMGKLVEHNFPSMQKGKLNGFHWSKMLKKWNKEYYSTHTYSVYYRFQVHPSRNQSKNIICNCHSLFVMHVCMRFRAWLFRISLSRSLACSLQWHYMQSNTWLWFDVQSNCIPFQWERKFNSHLPLILDIHKRKKEEEENIIYHSNKRDCIERFCCDTVNSRMQFACLYSYTV